MRLVEVTFRNHIRFGDMTIHTDQELVLFLGANGSGKSFLLSSCHPRASSSRSRTHYPFQPGKPGFVKIVYKDRDTLWECMHELTPKPGGRHACKSYLNRIQHGVLEELNPTGHVPKYEELVETHLHFNRDVPEVGMLSYKNNGITSSSPVRRKEVLETTMKLDTLTKMQKRAREQFREYRTGLRLQENKKVQLLQHGTLDQLEQQERDIREKLSIVVQVQEANQTKQQELESEIASLEHLVPLNVREVSQLLEVSNGILQEEDRPAKIAQICQAQQQQMITLSHQISLLTKEMEQMQVDWTNQSRLQELISSMQEMKDQYQKKQEQYAPYTLDPSVIRQGIQKLQSVADICEQVPSTTQIRDIPSQIRHLEDAQQKRIQFLDQYQLYQTMHDGNLYQIPYTTHCNTCDLYQKFGLAQEFLGKHQDRFLEELKKKVDTAERLEHFHRIQSAHATWKEVQTMFQPSSLLTERCHVREYQSFFDACHRSNFKMVLQQLVEYSSDLHGELMILERNLREREQEIQTRQSMMQRKEIHQQDLQQKEKERENMQEQLRQYTQDPKQKWYQNVEGFVIQYPETIAYYRAKRQEQETREQRLQELQQQKEQIRRVQEQTRLEQESWNQKLFVCQHNQKELTSIQSDILQFQETKDILEICTEILEKSIPTALLEQNLKFIEETTNRMLEENQIPIQIEIVPSEEQIQIPVVVHGKELEDIDMLSTGEQCLISLMMNACILHILGYPILCLDEIDANLDRKNREKFNNVLYSILETLQIDQIFCISHNVGTTIQNALKFVIGDSKGLDLPENECIMI